MTPCEEWDGQRDKNGYGKLGHKLAHRMAWEAAYGPIPVGTSVLHHCDNPPCTRADHLFLGTQRDNVLDMHAKGRARNGAAPRARCPQGHPYDEKNAYVRHRGGVRVGVDCLTCARIRVWARRRGLLGLTKAEQEALYNELLPRGFRMRVASI